MSTANTDEVRVLCTSSETPVMVRGSVSSQTAETVVIQIASGGDALSQGDRVVLAFTSADRGRVAGSVVSVSDADGGHAIEVNCATEHDRDKRDFPRLYAGLPIKYRVASSEEGAAWIGGEPAPTDGWLDPDPFMNFSVGGLRFDADRSVAAHDLLLIDFATAQDGPRWRPTARVIRVFEPESEESPTHSVAVAFVHFPDPANEALSELTLKIQDTLL